MPGSHFQKEFHKDLSPTAVLSPLLLKILINDFSYAIEHSQVCNLADNNTIFAYAETSDEVAK